MKKTKKKELKKSGNFIYNNFKISLNYIKESRNYIWFAVFLFLFSGVLGYIFPHLFEEQLLKLIKQLLDQTKDLDFFGFVSFITSNNIKSSLYGLIFGIVFSIIPIVIAVVNGFLLGFVSYNAVNSSGLLVLWKLFPHGIFEIPAVLISVGLGIKLGLFFLHAKKKSRGFFAIILSLMCFLVLLSVFSVVISLTAGSFDKVVIQNYTDSLMKNTFFIIFYIFLMLIFWFLSIFVSFFIFSKKESEKIKENFISDLKNSIRVFIFVIIPLLVIAGIIESALIVMLG
jgi:stage II sporulation protein M